MKKLLSCCWLYTLLLMPEAFAQSVDTELKFARYLFSRKNYEEADLVLNKLTGRSLSRNQEDSLYFLLGHLSYSQQRLQNSIANFSKVSPASKSLYTEALFYSSFQQAYLHEYTTATLTLRQLSTSDSGVLRLQQLQLAGIALLERKVSHYDSIATHFSRSHYVTGAQEQRLEEHRKRIVQQPRRSPALAAALSAVVPGAGKFYAGNKGQGLYTLLISSVLGLQAWEGYEKAGPRSARFIIYSSLFTSLYIGTVWGSAFSVKIKRTQLNETIDDQILFDMHIPIRSVFR